jgi:rod shape-determining protein MreC
VGIISKIYVDKKTNLFTLDVKLFNDMTSISHVYVIDNKNSEEIKTLNHLNNNE